MSFVEVVKTIFLFIFGKTFMNNFFSVLPRRFIGRWCICANNPFIKIVVWDNISLSRLLYGRCNCTREETAREKGRERRSLGFANILPCDAITNFLCLFVSSSNTCHKHDRDVACQPRWPQTISQRRIIHDRSALARSRSWRRGAKVTRVTHVRPLFFRTLHRDKNTIYKYAREKKAKIHAPRHTN